MGIRTLTQFSINTLIFKPDTVLSFGVSPEIEDWMMNNITKIFGCRNFKTFFVWPPEANRKRIYIHVLTTEGAVLGVAKVALSKEESKRIREEANILRVLNTNNSESFSTTSLLCDGQFGDYYYIMLEPIPRDARVIRYFSKHVHWKAICDYCGPIHIRSIVDIELCSWNVKYQSTSELNNTFTRELSQLVVHQGIKTCRVHGDFGPSNVLSVDGMPWIIDWEESCADGPWLTDVISYVMASRQNIILRNPRKGLIRLLSDIKELDLPFTLTDVMMALAFLHGSRFTLATKIIKAWDQSKTVAICERLNVPVYKKA